MLGPRVTSAYAIRALAYLAHRSEGRRSSHEIATATGIPRPYLVKLLHGLGRKGLVAARRGHGGGYRLARRPEEIRLPEVLDAVGAAPVLEHCLLGLGRCSARPDCPLHPTWARLRPKLRRRLDEVTLRDLGALQDSDSRADDHLGPVRPGTPTRRGPTRSKERP